MSKRATECPFGGEMANEKSLAEGNVGTVLDSFGGKSLKWIMTVGAAIFGCGVIAAILIRVLRPDGGVLATVVLGVGAGIALVYVSTNWKAALAKVEVCEGGMRLFRCNGRVAMPFIVAAVAVWRTRLLRQDQAIELPWDRILKIRVGKFVKTRLRPENVVIRTTDGNDIEFPFGFWATVGTARFATIVHEFVEDVEIGVEFA